MTSPPGAHLPEHPDFLWDNPEPKASYDVVVQRIHTVIDLRARFKRHRTEEGRYLCDQHSHLDPWDASPGVG